ncbi:ATP-binding cassette domain-containing protein [Mycobacterium paragordonae]|uniref:ATP-binding cassette domain-containing protein n=1 Tax=Mycobacterium paragordonae TaxID=1389713 RepID=A0A4R5WVY0_9MYCO|nr:ATP-binding cassette domain-containing protein [Mycobacterium paragordonae]MDP7736714.1 ATP-binding cassette domain-containing protein [Mycobacterium paragordonae]TDK98874.1 ATP-binding cassette domain-containing protein [Mycobacterium paragordonae]TDK99977.1 ATP-binding cassette domain-containing protein [Mycobacterium paragordonae]TDL09197.1 ATP-binding cassette domain-containing protein [Mycobacterium paragordonae]
MTRAQQPVLTVRAGQIQRTFSPGRDVIVGSDMAAEVRVAHPVVARAHLLLRFEQGSWIAIDNNSPNGIFVDGKRVPLVDIHDGLTVNLARPDGPRVSFEVEHHQHIVGLIPETDRIPAAERPPPRPKPASGAPPRVFRRPPPPGHPPNPVALTPQGPPAAHPGLDAPTNRLSEVTTVSEVPTRGINVLGAPDNLAAPVGRTAWIGRAEDCDIVVSDVLASRRHAYLAPTSLGTEIRDNHSINGTFVNGIRVGSAVLSEGDVVTIGNVDLTFSAGTLVRRTEAATQAGGLEVSEVSFSVDGKALLQKVSMTARPGTLTAIIGGSGAGKTTLARLIAGYSRPDAGPGAGAVTFAGHNIHTEYASLRSRIGMVPQDDVVHRQLTVNQALGYAAELRLPPDTTKADRAQVIAQVLNELGLTQHADTRVDRLSGGQRKRASVALELLTGPSLLILDEPTSGLDPALDLQVMTMLRQLADAGRVVLVVTHSLTYLDVCDQVLLMAPGGKTAYLGAPDQIGAAMGTTNWAHIFAKVGADPDEANRRFLAHSRPVVPAAAQAPGELGAPAHTSAARQFTTIARRQVRLVIADRAYFIFLAVLPFILGALSLTVPGDRGFGFAEATSNTPDEAAQILNLLSIAAVFMGTALTIRDLIGERPIFRREQAVGLSTWAYLGAKVSVFCAFAVLQAAVATGIVLLGKGAPTQKAVLLGNPSFELFVSIAATCVASAVLGLLLSSIARSGEQIMPLLVLSLMLQLVLAGGVVPVTNRPFLDQLSWLVPARWGYGASAATVNLRELVPGSISPEDSHWTHSRPAWLFDMAMLAALSVFYSAVVWWRIRLRR